MEPDLSQDFNYGIVPPPDLEWDAPRLQKPAWQPTPEQAGTARKQVLWVFAGLALVAVVCLVLALIWVR